MNYLNTHMVCMAGVLCLLALGVHAQHAFAQVEKPKQYISVGDYTGTANERIAAAIKDAKATKHKTVFLPNGTYALRHTIGLNSGLDTELHLVGESRDGVLLVPDIKYLEANYKGGDFKDGGARLAHMINLSSRKIFDFVDVSIQNMTLDMKSQKVYDLPVTYNVVGHGIRVGTGWRKGQFKVNHVTLKNIAGYGIGIQDRHGYPKSNMTLTNLHIERTGSDAIDTKNTSGDGSKNLIIRDVTIKDIGYTDGGFAAALDIRYRTVIIERVKLSAAARVRTPSGGSTNNGGISFRPNGGVLEARVSDVEITGFGSAITVHSSNKVAHENIDIRDFKIRDYAHSGIRVMGPKNTNITLSDGYVYSERGRAIVDPNQDLTIHNVTEAPWSSERDE